MKIFAKIRAFYVMFVVMFCVGLMIPFVLIFKKFGKDHVLRRWTSISILKLSGVKVEIEGQRATDTQMFVLNHQSMLDIMLLEMAVIDLDIAWVAKLELFKLKYFGLALSLTDMIDVDREDKNGIIKLLKDVKNKIDKKRVVAIFPEGTRNANDKFLPFKAGASMIANKYNLKVQPVLLVNSGKRFDVKNLVSSRGVVKIIFFEPFIASKDNDWLEDIKNKMQNRLLDEIKTIN